ncbi:GerAB/ArcD/ProY family transporter [Cohnella terricola]|uniref:GerAB/ArcD/ProY family transporter n=1 Tax=Cohnella terricola TaxID=1289167 RepID=A0A559JT55_9BACL|nr:GerAB/ArcD/ProY family transporter [Cohnella terricola]TVY03059.1 GerAB/ArcD/ProY family transporter [Cohnella terricola]
MNKIQTVTLLFLLQLASVFAVLPERMIAASSGGHWIAVTILFAVELLLLWLYLKALSLFPGKTVVEICIGAWGKWGTRLAVIPLLVFLMLDLILLAYYQSIEIKTVLLQQTPIAATSVLFVFLCLYGAWKGLAVIIRASIGWFFLFMPFVLFSVLISIKNFKFHYMFPLWSGSMSFLFHPDFYVGTVIFAGFLFLGMTSSETRIGFGKAAGAVGFSFVFALFSVYIPLLLFGQETAIHLQYPLLLASDTIDMEWVVFDWLPSFYVVSSSALGILKVSVLLWMFVSLLHRLFMPKANSRWILSFACVILYLSCQLIPNIGVLNSYLYLNSYFCLYATIVFPILVFLAAQRRRKKVSA